MSRSPSHPPYVVGRERRLFPLAKGVRGDLDSDTNKKDGRFDVKLTPIGIAVSGAVMAVFLRFAVRTVVFTLNPAIR